MQFCITHTSLRMRWNHSRLIRSVYTKVVFGNLGKTVAWGHTTVKRALLWWRHYGKCFWWWIHNAITMSSRDHSTMWLLIIFMMLLQCIQATFQCSNRWLLCCISELQVVHCIKLWKSLRSGYNYPCHKGRQNMPIYGICVCNVVMVWVKKIYVGIAGPFPHCSYTVGPYGSRPTTMCMY